MEQPYGWTGHTAYAKTLVPHTPVDTEAKNESEAKGKIRPFVNVYLREDQPAVTDIDRTVMIEQG
jgi:hypothetical protein